MSCDLCGVPAYDAPGLPDAAHIQSPGKSPDEAGPPRSSYADAASDAAELDVPLTWVTWHEHGRVRRCCDRCAREHVRDIEAKLDSTWW